MYDSLKITPKTRRFQVVFNHTNFHLYHFAGNNPIKYTDPDGRENVYSHKCGKNLYIFYTDMDVWDGAIRSLLGILPFGEYIGKGIDWCFDDKIIEEKDACTRIKAIGTNFLDSISVMKTVTKLSKVTNSFIKAFTIFANVAGYIGNLITAGEFFYQLTRDEEVAVNSLIDKLFSKSSLYSDSHENLATLYFYAKKRVDDLIQAKRISYTKDKWGKLISYSCEKEDIDMIKQELKLLNQILQENK